jgi:hypothetical protein
VWLAKNLGVGYVGLYLSTLAVLSFMALWLTRETRDLSLDNLADAKVSAAIETTSP